MGKIVMGMNLETKLLSIMKKKIYIKPMSEEVKIETSQMLAGSFTGNAPDSDDSEFGGAPERRGTWGNLWETENWKVKTENWK